MIATQPKTIQEFKFEIYKHSKNQKKKTKNVMIL